MKKLCLTLLLLTASIGIFAQSTAVGLWGGVSNYMGELSDNQINLDETHAAVGGLVQYYPNPFLSFRFGLSAVTISGSDANRTEDDPLRIRNLSFKSQIIEAAVIAEINLIGYDVEMGDPFSPYLFAGIAGIYHNPRALFEGAWYNLQEFSTEGQGTSAFPDRDPYSRFQVAFPFGVGMKFGVGSGLTLGMEAGLRYTLTDYLDDVSQTYVDPNILILEEGDLAYRLSNRSGEYLGGLPVDYTNDDPRGNPDDNDWFVMAGVYLTYTLGMPIGGGKVKRGCDYGF